MTSERDYLRNPALFVELAHRWAAGGPAPERQHEEWLKELTRPFLRTPAEARDALWGVLSYPERGRGLVWLDRMGLLHELFPCWVGERERRNRRLQSVEELHLERWAGGLSNESLNRIGKRMEEKIDGRLNRWALAGLACLLLTGDTPALEHMTGVERDMTILGATPAEINVILGCCKEYPKAYQFLVQGNRPENRLDLMTIAVCLSSLFAYPNLNDEQRKLAVSRADDLVRAQK